MYTIEYLLENSHLPGPRGNLELLYSFLPEADEKTVCRCLSYINDAVKNSPEEFAGMCGIVGYAVLHKKTNKQTIDFIRQYASHPSWRIREAVAMGIQEISENSVQETISSIESMISGNPYEQRAVVAGLCEPKLLKDTANANVVLHILKKITENLDHNSKLSDGEESLRKALGYGWSVAIVHSPEEGKKLFEELVHFSGKHIRWIVKENLKKNRLIKMDRQWTETIERSLAAV